MFTDIKYECLRCGHKDKAQPHNLLKGHGCPNCNKSRGENIIHQFLQTNNIDFVYQYKFSDLKGTGGGVLSFDFFLPKSNLLIEYQGEFHDGTANIQNLDGFIIQKEHDKRKREYTKLHNIDLLEIWYWDYKNIEQILSEKLDINNNQKSA